MVHTCIGDDRTNNDYHIPNTKYNTQQGCGKLICMAAGRGKLIMVYALD